jgi:hypothetical protein
MSFIILPNIVETAINAKIDAFLEQHPELAIWRESMYNDLVAAYSEYGEIANLEVAE